MMMKSLRLGPRKQMINSLTWTFRRLKSGYRFRAKGRRKRLVKMWRLPKSKRVMQTLG